MDRDISRGGCRGRQPGSGFYLWQGDRLYLFVSVVANVVFDLVRNSPHTGSTDPIAFAAPRRTADSPTAGALIPAPPETVANIAPVEPVPATAAPPADKPGPGSGGLY
jgi:hypothetical protein